MITEKKINVISTIDKKYSISELHRKINISYPYLQKLVYTLAYDGIIIMEKGSGNKVYVSLSKKGKNIKTKIKALQTAFGDE